MHTRGQQLGQRLLRAALMGRGGFERFQITQINIG